MATDAGYLPRLGSREEFVDYLQGNIDPTVAELQDGKLNRKWLKTYMLETARCRIQRVADRALLTAPGDNAERLARGSRSAVTMITLRNDLSIRSCERTSGECRHVELTLE